MESQFFGKQRMNDFYMDPEFLYINHGSFGACPITVLQAKSQIERTIQRNCEKFMRIDLKKQIRQVRNVVAKEIKCKTENVFLVQNATEAINSLLKTWRWEKGDSLLLTNITHNSVKKTASFVSQRQGIIVHQIQFLHEDLMTKQNLIQKICKTVESLSQFRIKLAVIDHISSGPAVKFPVQTLIPFFRNKQIKLIIDGAHAVGQLTLNMNELKPDAYYSNYHKWGFSPKSASLLYLSDQLKQVIRPALTGSQKDTGIENQFLETGTRSFCAHLSVPKGLEYLNSLGRSKTDIYCRELMREAGRKMAQIWSTKVLVNDPQLQCRMSNIEVPSNDKKQLDFITQNLIKDNICFLKTFEFDGKLYCRISVHVYNEISDYIKCAESFLFYQKQYQQKPQQND